MIFNSNLFEIKDLLGLLNHIDYKPKLFFLLVADDCVLNQLFDGLELMS